MSEETQNKKVEVKSENGNFLFLYLVEKHVIEVHRRGLVYQIPLQDLIEFGRTSQRNVFRVVPTAQPQETGDIVRQGFE